MWPLKIAVWLGCIVAMFFVQPSAFQNYWIATFVFAAIFILIQAVLLVRASGFTPAHMHRLISRGYGRGHG
jgi:hypothetical protein